MCMGRLSDGVLVLSGRIHNLVDGSRVPCHTIMLLYRIRHLSLLYDTFQPALHNILMDNKEVWDRPGMTCACMDALGIHGRSRLTVCVDCIVFSSGRCMTRGLVVG